MTRKRNYSVEYSLANWMEAVWWCPKETKIQESRGGGVLKKQKSKNPQTKTKKKTQPTNKNPPDRSLSINENLQGSVTQFQK